MTPILRDLKTTGGGEPAGAPTFSQLQTLAVGRERKKWLGVSISF